MSAGGVPSALAIIVTFGCRNATSTCGVAVASVQPSSCRLSASLSSDRNAVVGQDLPGEVQVLLRHHVRNVLVSSSADSCESMPSYLFGMTMSTP